MRLLDIWQYQYVFYNKDKDNNRQYSYKEQKKTIKITVNEPNLK